MIEDRNDGGSSDFKYYNYVSSMAAAITFVACFSLATTLHVFQMTKTRTWFMVPFCLGGACTYNTYAFYLPARD